MSERDLIERLSAAEADRRAFEKAYGAASNLPWREGGPIKPADMYIMRQGKMYNTHLLSAAWIGWQLARAADATTIASLSEALAEAEEKGAEAERAMRDVITQADCLRHYARIEDSRQYKITETVGEIQAGHFEDIAVRLFPSLQAYLDRKRAERAPPRDLSQGGQHG